MYTHTNTLLFIYLSVSIHAHTHTHTHIGVQEGICLTLNPDFKLLEVAYPIISCVPNVFLMYPIIAYFLESSAY